MMKKKFYLEKKFSTLLLLLMFSIQSFAERTPQIKLIISDAYTNETLPFVTVLVEMKSTKLQGKYSDLDGFVSFYQLPKGKCTFTIQYLGYEKQQLVLNIDKGTHQELKVLMKPIACVLTTCEIVGYQEPIVTKTRYRCCFCRCGLSCGMYFEEDSIRNQAKEQSTQLNSIENNRIKMYPNPASSAFQMSLGNEIAEIRISDLSGKEVRRINTENQSTLTIEVSDLARGAYLVHYVKDGKPETQKLILE